MSSKLFDIGHTTDDLLFGLLSQLQLPIWKVRCSTGDLLRNNTPFGGVWARRTKIGIWRGTNLGRG